MVVVKVVVRQLTTFEKFYAILSFPFFLRPPRMMLAERKIKLSEQTNFIHALTASS